ncbi:FAD-dependent monooxygenase [Streptomyces sp. NPDC005805]|uniref:FAD-dependent monooxygenase n=1 Tax=Streptomyces sp. NPDC005805 TaxID=3157068 RepID=UPI0033D6E3E1
MGVGNPGVALRTGGTVVDTDVLVVGAGPVGLTAALELRRRGVACRVIDKLPGRLPYAKAVGVQPRTLELWDRAGVVRDALDAATPMRGQLAYVNGAEAGRVELVLPPEVPYGFACLPQYETERILTDHLERRDTRIERGTELVGFEQDEGGVWCRLITSSGDAEEVRCRFLVGCDGAHSAVRKGLGLSFEGGAFPEEYMLADVEADWSLPPGYGVRSMHRGPDGAVDDLLVCIPLPGHGRYRMSMLVPPELSAAAGGGADTAARSGQAAGGARPDDGVTHGLEAARTPDLGHIQAVVDRLAPEPTTLSALRWSSVFRISHRIVDRYGRGRVFVAGDAAHIHPPTGAQGMNTGIQDAVNLAWKLALAVSGAARPALLESYDAERRPVGEEVVGRTVRHASAGGVQADPDDPRTLLLREAQLLLGYRGSPVVGRTGPADAPGNAGTGTPDASGNAGTGAAETPSEPGPGAPPQAGDRAPDCGGLLGPVAAYPVRLFDLLRDSSEHVLVVYAPDPESLARFAGPAAEASRLTYGRTGTRAVLGAAEPPVGDAGFPTWADSRGEFRRAYGAEGPAGFLVRPDGYVGLRFGPDGTAALSAYLSGILRT